MCRSVLASWLVLLSCICVVACGRRVRGGSGFPQDSGSNQDAGDHDGGNLGTDAGADASADASSADAANTGDAATDASTDATTDTGNVITSPPPDGSCDGAEFNGHTYWFCTANHNWDEARPLCAGVSGDLVSINDANEQAFIEDHASPDIWLIGLNQKNASGSSANGTWEMVDGTTLASYENWGLTEPDANDCGAIGGNGAWMDVTCSNDENWICEIP